ncbi:MAG: 4-hydroxybenzoate octaprenyltransferase [Paracoccus sp. (in: a-proteobacteria)]|uniref:4-hydroxybenzoate octaprenyltransferase n=1 Tax=Paracoccus sp. TaxID=267 RepID=UPI0026DEC859|nr:4-hydroxybenzoate octaprenyltransferase [Paracoccus sp. (in: a-proteobacteria)]MDO5621165.1 4-hydroxybenzoate octaprenyltransferase [Paracoccus sp. (in: a-proteobacteria)]
MPAPAEMPDPVHAPVHDAPARNWVDLYAPAAWRPLLRMSRADRPIGTWLLLLPCWFGIGLAMLADGPEWRDLWLYIACAIGAVTMRGAGCTWNDITDRDFDAQVARTRSRPLPSGQVTLRGAYIWLAVQTVVGLAVLLTMGRAAVVMGALSLGPLLIYPFAKRFTWWPQIFLGIAFNWGVLLAYVAHMGRLDAAPVIAWLSGIAWTVFYDTIYAHQDTQDDAQIGVKSTARLFGDNSPRILPLFGALSCLLMVVAVLATGAGGLALLIALAGVVGYGAHMVWQMRVFRPDDPDNCMILFRANRDTGLILAASLAVAAIV